MILDKIVAHKREEVSLLKKRGYGAPLEPVDQARGFQKALTSAPGLAIIAEAKKASPSKGLICPEFDPVRITLDYRRGGARAVSVLTDERFFQGRIEYISAVRAKVDLPVLRKDFIIHEIQIQQALAFGADAILLIAAILDPVQLGDYINMSLESGIDALVEVHDETEVDKSLKAGARLIGINNRNLRDFSVDLATTFRLNRLIPSDVPVVSESGIGKRDELMRLQEEGVSAVLIGETLMRAADRVQALKNLVTVHQGY